jgi:ADP-ribose pyrophosphatase
MLGQRVSGVSVVAYYEDRLLLLREFRMGVNKYIYNLCAGMLEQDETIEDCIRRELYEETGLQLKRIIHILKPSYAAVAISDVKTQIAFVEAEGILSDNTSENEKITAAFYTREQVRELLEQEEFSSRAQMAAWFFTSSII